MADSNTYNFSPNLGELVIYAFNLCGIRATSLLQEHMESARMAANLMQGRWSAQGVNLWQVDLQTVPLVQGQATYTVPVNTIVMLDSYITITNGSTVTNRIITPIGRSEYASYSNPQIQGMPTVWWMDRLLSPTFTLYPVPDGTQTSMSYYRLRQTQNALLANGTDLEIPYYFYEAAAYGLAYRLAMIWAADKVAMLKPLADEAYQIAADQNVETANTYLSPVIAGYFSP